MASSVHHCLRMTPRTHALVAGVALAIGASALHAAPAAPPRLAVTEVDREPTGARAVLDADAIAKLHADVVADPANRAARFALVRGLQRAGRRDAALAAAKAWRAADAYNLVVVRLLGDLYMERGDAAAARRAYSAVVELLPKDAAAHRALASVLKQAGDLRGAYDRLAAAALDGGADRRLAFELADVAARLGETADARARFEAVIADEATPEAVRYPAKQRLAQLYQQLQREAERAGKPAEVAQLATAIADLGLSGGTQNDIKIYLTWDTDHSDVDLWVTSPGGEKVFYSHTLGKHGESLFDDVTTGYGPESYTANRAQPGVYQVEVNYFGRGRSNFSEARGEVTIVLDEGKPTERKQVLPYRLFEQRQTVTVASIQVGEGAR